MKKKTLLLTLIASGLVLAACGGKPKEEEHFTYRGYASSLGTKWDPFTWETSADNSMLDYVSEGFVGMVPLNTKTGSWQWSYDLAKSVTDVTAAHVADLDKYHVAHAEGVTSGYVYDVKINTSAKWEEKTIGDKVYGGKNITIDEIIESFKLMMDPASKNYRANLYYAGESAVAGGNQYYFNDQQRVYNAASFKNLEELVEAVQGGETVYFDVWDFWGAKGYVDADGNECPQYVSVLDETVYDTPAAWAAGEAVDAFNGISIINYYGEKYFDYFLFFTAVENWGYGKTFEETVGIYKVSNDTFRYVLATKLDMNYFMTSLTSGWLVNVELYNDLTTIDEATGIKKSTYGTSADTTISYGPYKLVSYEDEKQAVFTQNENWHGWKKDGPNLVSKTTFKVDGKTRRQYQTTDVVIDVMEDATAKLKFESGELNDYTPTAQELPDYVLSSVLYQVDETYTMSLFFNTDPEVLAELDKTGGNTNSIVLTNYNFRKAFSFAVNRSDWVKTTEAYKPAFTILNNLYYYDAYNNPNSQYRQSEQAMQAMVDLYGVEYGSGKTYKNLREAYESITGFDLVGAKALMKQAYDELLAENAISAGANITIRVAYKAGNLESSDYAQVAALEGYLNAALDGSGFGTLKLEPVGGLTGDHSRYKAVPHGEYAIGYGAWGGAAFYPFRNFQVYMDPDQYPDQINELGCWDPTTETFTLPVNGKDVTMTYQQWSQCMVGEGRFADESFEVKLEILAALEKDFLNKYYRIPLAGSTACFLLGYQQQYYTQEYNIMYDFGGSRLMIYNYNDAEWAAYVESQGHKLNYK